MNKSYIPSNNSRVVLKVLALALATTVIAGTVGCTSKGFGSGRSGKAGESAYNRDNLTEYELAAEREARFGEGTIPTAESAGIFRDIFFDYDSSTISDEARMDIQANASLLKENPQVKVQLEGHCDERGTEEYNLALGDYRAKSVKSTLLELGVPATQIETISYGENVPLEKGDSDYALAMNRRVHFSAVSGAATGGKY
jgi:peptidoglycan-associated lipoprotein